MTNTAQVPSGWQPMTAGDIAALLAIADNCHPDHPEDEAVFRERLHLFPNGCSVLRNGHRIAGYMICHPYPLGMPVPLNGRLGSLPRDADALYIHDLAIDPGMRGQGLATSAVARARNLACALKLNRMALVAINGSVPFWERHGFASVDEAALTRLLIGYGQAGTYMVSKPANAWRERTIGQRCLFFVRTDISGRNETCPRSMNSVRCTGRANR